MKGTSLLTACSDGVVRKFILNESLHGPRTIEVFTRLEEKENSQIKIILQLGTLKSLVNLDLLKDKFKFAPMKVVNQKRTFGK